MAFVHLHAHTEYSLLDSSNRIRDYVARVKELGMNSAAITDHGNMHGVIEFYSVCREAGINPILGCEVYVAPGSRLDKGARKGELKYYHLVLLAENNRGYRNLMTLVSLGFTEGFYSRPRVDLELLQRYHEGLIALSACARGEVSVRLIAGDHEGAKLAAQKYEACFGKGNFFLEIQDHGLADQKKVNSGMLKLSEETGIPLVATNDVHYTRKEDSAAHDHLICIGSGKKLSDTDRIRYEGTEFYVKSDEEMAELFRYAPDAVAQTQRIADRCHVEITFNDYKIPRYESPECTDTWEYINRICDEGLKWRYPDDDKEARKRLDYELGVIRQMGFVDYFLIAWDYVGFARKRGILVGPGRGSGAGSIVAYCMHLTDVDPLKYGLIFERFLNPGRVSMPDLDIDFLDERRSEVIDYVMEKYGAERTAKIAAFDTLKSKRVIRDVARVRDLPLNLANELASMIPPPANGEKMTIPKAMERNNDLKKRYDEDQTVRELLDICIRLEGIPRNLTKHPAGILIAPKPVMDYVPVCLSDQYIMTQFPAPTVEKLGLLKMDFLSLKTLTDIRHTMDSVEERYGIKVETDKLPLDDRSAFSIIGDGLTDGIFQLENRNMTDFMTQLKPRNIDELIAGISLFRPGPMDSIPKYLAGRQSPDTVTYDCEELRPILAPTYGCIVYQEQVMQIVRDLAGFSMSQADDVRKAMSKKQAAKMEEGRKDFVDGNPDKGIKGCVANGINREIADALFDRLIVFAGYAFNKSHAAAYAVVAYQTAYLKSHWPKEYMAAILTSKQKDTKMIVRYTASCRKMGIAILPPDINESNVAFTPTDGGIRFGLSAIKGVGEAVSRDIIQERKLSGDYRSMSDLIKRQNSRVLNKKTVECLIRVGAFDSTGATRSSLLKTYEQEIDNSARSKREQISGQMSLFDLFGAGMPSPDASSQIDSEPELPKDKLLDFEKELLGVYVSGHPLDEFREVIAQRITLPLIDLQPELSDDDEEDNDGAQITVHAEPAFHPDQTVTVAGLMSDIREILTKKGEQMAFVVLEDAAASVEVIVFPKTFAEYRKLIVSNEKVFVTGKVQVRPGAAPKVIADRIEEIRLPVFVIA